jgi:hypothetical protein
MIDAVSFRFIVRLEILSPKPKTKVLTLKTWGNPPTEKKLTRICSLHPANAVLKRKKQRLSPIFVVLPFAIV